MALFRRTILACFGLLLLGLPASQAARPEMIERGVAILQGLDKVTARVSRIEAPVGREVSFGRLTITVRTCRENPPIEPPEAAAFLEIVETKPGETPQQIFSGWMFASSPALSALEHPIYDITVVGCAES